MSDRLISDNILVAFETLHHLRNKRKGKSGYMALKLDMSKAYHKVERVFLEKNDGEIRFWQQMDIPHKLMYTVCFFPCFG